MNYNHKKVMVADYKVLKPNILCMYLCHKFIKFETKNQFSTTSSSLTISLPLFIHTSESQQPSFVERDGSDLFLSFVALETSSLEAVITFRQTGMSWNKCLFLRDPILDFWDYYSRFLYSIQLFNLQYLASSIITHPPL